MLVASLRLPNSTCSKVLFLGLCDDIGVLYQASTFVQSFEPVAAQPEAGVFTDVQPLAQP